MAPEAGLYLRKALQSLASAEVDLDAGRHNSAANRAYYAAFQAAVAALIAEGVRPQPIKGNMPDWGHEFVMNEFSGRLVWRRRTYPVSFLATLTDLFDRRIDADYRAFDVGERRARMSAVQARELVEAVTKRLRGRAAPEQDVAHEEDMSTASTRSPGAYAGEVKARILAAYPEARVDTYERGPRQFTLEVLGDYGEDWDVHDALGDLKAMIQIEHGVWVVVLQGPLGALVD